LETVGDAVEKRISFRIYPATAPSLAPLIMQLDNPQMIETHRQVEVPIDYREIRVSNMRK